MNIERVDAPEVVAARRTIVTALPLKPAARQRLAELLHARVVDIRDPVDRVDLVLTPACSPQLIGHLTRKYEGARVIVVELDDGEFDIELTGPVTRIIRAGADAYLLADSLDELARKIAPTADLSGVGAGPPPPAVHELPASATVDEIIEAFLRESVEYSTHLRVSGGREDDAG